MASKFLIPAGGNFNDDTSWSTTSGGANDTTKPTAGDDAFLDANSGACTLDSGSVMRSLNCTGYTNTLTHNAFTCSIGDGTAGAGNIALKLVAGMTYNKGNATGSAFSLISTAVGQQTIDTGAKSMGNFTINGAGSSYLLSSAFTSAGLFTLSQGTFATGNLAMSCSQYTISGASARVFSPGSSVLTSTNTGAVTVWNAGTVTNLTGDLSGMVFTITGGTGSERTFIGGGLTYGTLNYVIGASAGLLIITGSNTFDVLNVTSPSSNHPLQLTAGTTTTILTTFNVNGRAGAVMVFSSTTGGVPAILTKSSGTVNVSYLSIQDSTAQGGATWNADANSVNVSGNTGWNFAGGGNGNGRGNDGSMFFFFT